MRKQWKGVAMALAAVLAVCGCGNGTTSDGSDSGGRKQEENLSHQTQSGTADGAKEEEPVYSAITGYGDDSENSDRYYAWEGLLVLISLMEEGYLGNVGEPIKFSDGLLK